MPAPSAGVDAPADGYLKSGGSAGRRRTGGGRGPGLEQSARPAPGGVAAPLSADASYAPGP